MHTPSLRRRVTVAGLVVLVSALLVADVAVFLLVRASLESNLREVLGARVAVAEQLAREHAGSDLADRLTASGIPAIVRGADGSVIQPQPAVPRSFAGEAASPPATLPEPTISETVEVEGGTTVEVLATRAGVVETLRTLAMSLTGATVAIAAVAVGLLGRTTAEALEPLDEIIDKAEQTASGELGVRLSPDDPGTELGRLAVALDRMLDGLEASLSRSQEAHDMVQRFMADAAHQLRTPLTSVRAALELILRDTDLETRDQMMAMAIRETSRASRLVDGLLHMARLEAGVPLDPQPADLNRMIEQEAERIRSVAPSLEVETDLEDPPGGRSLVIDAGEVLEAISNLMDNARRHAVSRIEVTSRWDDRRGVEVRIRDDGPGVPRGHEEIIFERFVSEGAHQGSGLGLAVARAVARAHGGDAVHEDGAFVIELSGLDEREPSGDGESLSETP